MKVTKMASQKEIDAVWNKGKPIAGRDPDLYRKDPYGNTIYKPAYGTQGKMGWEIDHDKPKAKGGSEAMQNKQPVQTEANREKSDKYPFR